MELKCQFCEKIFKNKGALKKHEISCKYNPSPQKCGGRERGCAPWNKGLTKETDDRIIKGCIATREAIVSGRYIPHRTLHSDETKNKMSAKKKELYSQGWEPVCGRCKKYDYYSPIAGNIKVDGTWELKVAKHLDKINVKWIRNTRRFDYVNLTGKKSTYQPDFYIYDWNSYLEVKGYETELDRCKWSQFKESLIIWRKKDIQILED